MMNFHDEITELYISLASRMAEFLRDSQVIWPERSPLECKQNNISEKLLWTSNKELTLNIAINNSRAIIQSKNKVTVAIGDFFRISETGIISYIPSFQGLRPLNKYDTPKTNIEKSTSLQCSKKPILKLALKKIPYLFKIVKVFQATFFPEKEIDLSKHEGVSFRILIDPENNFHILECYDHGGIFERRLNAEGETYPPQVAGNYYADGYSALTFLRQYDLTKDICWLQAAERSWRFVTRVYPQYKPASIVWHHSDFKNAAILEIVTKYSTKYPQFNWNGGILVEDFYEPTNIYALRVYWKSIALKNKIPAYNSELINQDINRLVQEQTLEGLFHDNIATYPDAHDLTYHQYSTACLAQAIAFNEDIVIRGIFKKACNFTLNFFGPKGEPAYTGRASNNLHQSASCILAMHVCSSIVEDPSVKNEMMLAAFLAAKRLKIFQLSDGFIPTGLNHEVDLRMGWNHCGGTYNALASYFLMRATDFIEHSIEPAKVLPLQKSGINIANDSGYASISDGKSYIVVFSGCDESYGWSEGKHKTGVAGIALFSHDNFVLSEVPSLDFVIQNQQLISDLPTINGHRPYGRGMLKLGNPKSSIVYEHEYGGAHFERCYELTEQGLKIETTIESNFEMTIEGLVKWCCLAKLDMRFKKIAQNKIQISYQKEALILKHFIAQYPNITIDWVDKKIPNAKGFCYLASTRPLTTSKTIKSTLYINYCRI